MCTYKKQLALATTDSYIKTVVELGGTQIFKMEQCFIKYHT